MKKMNAVTGAVCLAALIGMAGCGSTSGAEKSVSAPVKKAQASDHVERFMIDWKGASVGAEVPAWVYDAVEEDYGALSSMPQLSKKKIICAESQGRNLDLLKSWVNNFDVQGSFSRSLSNFVIAQFGGEQSGAKGSAVKKEFLDEIVSSFSRTEITGLSKELDFWVKTREVDKDADSFSDTYEYFVVYAISQPDFEYQLNKVLGLVKAQNEAEEEIKSRVFEKMNEAQVFAEQKEL